MSRVARVSVLLPVRNGLPYLEQAIDSIVAQTLPDWELVVIDNGSTDGSAEYVERRAGQDGRILLLHQDIPGVSHTLNFGLDHCRAAWVARMDADDRSLPQRLERQLGFMEANHDVVALSCWAYYINAEGRRIARAPNDLSTREAFEDYRRHGRLIEIVHPGAMLSREALDRAGRYRPAFEPAEDVDLWTRLSEHGYVLALPDYLLEYRLHGGSVVRTQLSLALMKREWARACMQARRHGLPEPGWDAFRDGWSRAPWLRRAHNKRLILADSLFRLGREDIAAGKRLAGLGEIAAASTLRPMRTAPRLLRHTTLTIKELAPRTAPASGVPVMTAQPSQPTATVTSYSKRFFDSIREESRRSADVVVPIALSLLQRKDGPVSSVIDVGCGAGAWLASFIAHGVDDVRGLDGSYVDKTQLQIGAGKFVSCDLERQRADEVAPGSYDLAVSLEVAEHLTQARSLELVDSLTRLAPAVLFSAAVPHQAGTHHINCHWQSFWAACFRERGYVALDVIRPRVWDNPDVEWWFAQNTILYVREDRLAGYPALAGQPRKPDESWALRTLDRVHPRFLDHLDSFDSTSRSFTQVAKALPGAFRQALVHRGRSLGLPV